ncbi:MAG TPA: hypothetical protein VHV83_17845, partial [Armatimonadota bacterium]|nr:hypothetical protein [Armatimonadota bacterium]
MTTHIRRYRSLASLLSILITIAIIFPTVPAFAEELQIQVTIDPQRVNYDANGPNRVAIRVEVRDSFGAPAPNMTPVHFSTTLGDITQLAYTQNGQAIATLENQQGPGKATVTIVAGSSQQVRYIEFVGPGETATKQTTTRLSYRLHAKQCYYSAKKGIFDLRDGAEFIAPDFTVQAGAIQFSAHNNLLTAQQQVVVTAGNHTFAAERLRMDVSTRKGALVELTPDICYKTFQNLSTDPVVDDNAKTMDFSPQDPLPTKTWILFREARVYPNDQIQFRWPEFYVDRFDHCLMRLPYHVLDLRASSTNTFFNTRIDLTSDAGLNVDFPFFYAANDRHIGSIHLLHVTQGSQYYRDQAGFQIGVQEEYLMGNNGDGALYLEDLT